MKPSDASTTSRIALIALVAAVCTAACGGSAGDEETSWVGTITTDGNVTTVVNEAGSVWGGTATLIEELSIGVESGAEEYMFGRVGSLYATDELIYVLDAQLPAVRAYDHDGNFVRTYGASGQGPGEYTRPSLVAADSAGRVFVLVDRLGRINVYEPGGAPLAHWPLENPRCCAWPMYALDDGTLWLPMQEWFERDGRRDRFFGVQAIGLDGLLGEMIPIPEIDYERSTFEMRPGSDMVTPFSARLAWNPAPGGRLLVGASDRYRFEVHERDGSKLVVERSWEPVPVPPEHAEWERRRTLAFHRGVNNPEASWDGSGMPSHKPAYDTLVPALSGETWVARSRASTRLDDCAEDPLQEGHPAGYERPCWQNEQVVDVFGADGRYLGEVELPEGAALFALTFFIDGDRIVAAVEDAAGTITVRRYRLMRPEGEMP